MSEELKFDRFEELQVGLLLGDLSPEEEAEYARMAEERGCSTSPDASIAWTMAGLDAALHHAGNSGKIPESLKIRIVADVPRTGGRSSSDLTVIKPDFKAPSSAASGTPSPQQGSLSVFWSGWAAAAAILCLWVGVSMFPGENVSQDMAQSVSPSTAASPESLQIAASDAITESISGLGPYQNLQGRYVWSDERQQGFLDLSGLPVNDPSSNQYQLWIVDPQRDPDAPVDGGVFDITSNGRNIIPINAKLNVRNPAAFVITLEQPGGVVKSKQEVVVGIGKNPGAA